MLWLEESAEWKVHDPRDGGLSPTVDGGVLSSDDGIHDLHDGGLSLARIDAIGDIGAIVCGNPNIIG